MEEIPMNEQWKLDGDCRICRRAKYCTKMCKARRITVERYTNALAAKVFVKAILNQGKRKEKEGEDADLH